MTHVGKGNSVKRAKKSSSNKHPVSSLGKERSSFAQALANMRNVGLDSDFFRSQAVDEMYQFMSEREAESTKGDIDLKELLTDGRS